MVKHQTDKMPGVSEYGVWWVILDYACILHALSNIKSRTRIDRKHTRKLIVERTSWNPRDASYLIQKKNPIVRK